MKSVKNGKKESHMSVDSLLETRSGWMFVMSKGSHRSPYVTRSAAVNISKLVTFEDFVCAVYPNCTEQDFKATEQDFKATALLQRQCVNGGLAGDNGSNL